MLSLIFATSNEHKLKEAREILGIEVEGTSLDIPEIQSLNEDEVVRQKAIDYYDQIQKPLFVEDVSLTFHTLGKLPGTYINDFSKQLGNEGLIKLLDGKDDRSATATVSIGYIHSDKKITVFQGSIEGSIALEEKGEMGFGWDPIFIPEGESQTFAEMDSDAKNRYSMRGIAFREFKKWLDRSR